MWVRALSVNLTNRNHKHCSKVLKIKFVRLWSTLFQINAWTKQKDVQFKANVNAYRLRHISHKIYKKLETVNTTTGKNVSPLYNTLKKHIFTHFEFF